MHFPTLSAILIVSSTVIAGPLLQHAGVAVPVPQTLPASRIQVNATINSCPPQKILGNYYPSWTSSQTPAQMDWNSIDLGFYFVVITTVTGLDLPSGDSEAQVQSFVASAHSHGKKALVSIGGWDGSAAFSTLTSTHGKRLTFSATIKTFINQYGFDGLDIDWEYPGQQGIGYNVVSNEDSANYLAFLRVLRKSIGTKLIHASVPTNTFIGSDGNPIANMQAYGALFDYVTLMAYDAYGPGSDTTGPNAPLDICSGGNGGAVQAVNNWVNAQFPKCKILLGIPTYSHSMQTAAHNLTKSTINGIPSYIFQKPSGSQPSDPVYGYADLITNGFLSADGRTGKGNYTRYYDNCTQTPFLFNNATRSFITYDDAVSTKAKVQYAIQAGIAGVNFFESTGAPASTFDAARSLLTASGIPTGLMNAVELAQAR